MTTPLRRQRQRRGDTVRAMRSVRPCRRARAIGLDARDEATGIRPLEDVTVTVTVDWLDDGQGSDLFGRAAGCLRATAAPDDVLRVEHVGKRFGALVALRDVNLHLRRGELLGLFGDNASGKSTLMKIIAGFLRPSAGRMILRGAPVELKSVDHARSLGIDCVYQDLALVDHLSVWENIYLRREVVHRPLSLLARRRMRAGARRVLDDLGVRVSSVDLPVGQLSGGQRQAIAVARSMRSPAEIMLLDEPVAAMGVKESAAMLELIGHVREQVPASMILVAHNYAQVTQVCDRVNLLEDGCVVLDTPAAETSVEELTSRMTASHRAG
jgi:simple sugar transport system ATP-binding protein